MAELVADGREGSRKSLILASLLSPRDAAATAIAAGATAADAAATAASAAKAVDQAWDTWMKVTVGGDTGRALAEVYESLGEYGSESRSADLMPHIMEIVYIAARGNMKISTVTGSPLGQMLEAMQVYLAPALAKVLD